MADFDVAFPASSGINADEMAVEFGETQVVNNGANGLSAYEIALKNGFEGSEIEWLESLKGTPGEQGVQGPQGVKGDKGDKGDTGATGAAGKNGADGKTPVKGVDYWTTADKAEMVGEVKDNGALMYTEQELTDEQKAQARKNIEAMQENAVISLNTKQINALDALFKTASYVKDVSAEYAAFCDAFGLVNPTEEPERAFTILLHRTVGKLDNNTASISQTESLTRMMIRASALNSRRFAYWNGQWWENNSDFSPVPIPKGAVSMVYSIPNGMKLGIAFLGESADNEINVKYLGDTGWITASSGTIDVTSYNDGNHYWSANLSYTDNREIPADFDEKTIDVYFVDANGNRLQ